MEILRTPLEVFVFQKLLFDSLHVNAWSWAFLVSQERAVASGVTQMLANNLKLQLTIPSSRQGMTGQGRVGFDNQSRQAPGGTLEFALTPILVQNKK